LLFAFLGGMCFGVLLLLLVGFAVLCSILVNVIIHLVLIF
jgi:hypothetical protein